MTNRLQVGRVGLDSSLSLIPRDHSISNKTLTFTGEMFDMTATEWKWARQNIQNLVGNADEPVVPVVWAGDSRLNGYYAPRAVEVAGGTGYTRHGKLAWSIELEKVYGGMNVDFDDTYIAYVRATDHGSIPSTALPTFWVPAEHAPWADLDAATDSGTSYGITSRSAKTSTGLYNVGLASGQTGNFATRHRVDPADYYDGSCEVEIDSDGTGAWRTLHGTEVAFGISGRWRINNGIIRVTQNSSTTADLDVEMWTGAAFVAAGTFRVATAAFAAPVDPQAVFVIENNSLQAKVRYRIAAGTGVDVQQTAEVDVCLQRGQQFVEIGSYGRSNAPVLGASTTIACTSGGAGYIYRTTASGGLHFMILGPDTHTQDLTNGRITITNPAIPYKRWGIGVYKASSPGTFNGRTEVAAQYFGGMAASRRFLIR